MPTARLPFQAVVMGWPEIASTVAGVVLLPIVFYDLFQTVVLPRPAVRKFLARNRRLRLERLPAYSPDLNPVEAVWSWLKYGRLANFVPAEICDAVMKRVLQRGADG